MKQLLYTLLFCMSAAYCSAQKYKPALNLNKGNTYYLNSNTTSAIVQTVAGQENKINLSFSFQMAFKVIDITDTIYHMEVSYQALDIKMDLPGGAVDMDSKKNDPNDVPSSIIAAMMNKPFNVELTKTGKVKSVANIDKILSAALDGFRQIDTAKKAQVKAMFTQSFGPDAFKGSIETGTAIFPDAPVAKEDRWIVRTTLQSPVKAAVTMNYQLADVIEDNYLIHGNGDIITDKNAPAVKMNGLSIKYDLHGSLVSDIRVNKVTGWISEVKLKQVTMGNMQILDAPAVPGGMTIPISFNTEATTTGK